MRYIIHPKDHTDSERLGGKAAALAAVQRADLPVPPWFVLAPEAFYASMNNVDEHRGPTVMTPTVARRGPRG
jgi:phosphoenolpyruvate synthase/pyruvate phosphate dikinase